MLWIGMVIGLMFGFALGTFFNYRSYERGYKDGSKSDFYKEE